MHTNSANPLIKKNLFYPVNNTGPCIWALLQYFEVYKHRIPFGPKLIIPEEISNHLWSCILKDSSTAINCGACLMTKSPSNADTWYESNYHKDGKDTTLWRTVQFDRCMIKYGILYTKCKQIEKGQTQRASQTSLNVPNTPVKIWNTMLTV